MTTTFLISYQISLLLQRILQCLTVFCLTGAFLGIQNLIQHVHLFFQFIFVEEFVHYIEELLPNNKNNWGAHLVSPFFSFSVRTGI